MGAATERDRADVAPRRAARRAGGWRALVAALLPLAATLLAFRAVPQVYFLGDDFVHLVDVVNRGLADTLWRPFMGHLYVVPTLLYWALWHTAGMDARVFLGVALGFHLVAVALFHAVAALLTGDRRLAALAATLWGTWPFHAGSLGWFCVHGHVLAGAALLAVLLGLARAARDEGSIAPRRAAVWSALLLAAGTGFGTGLGVAAVFPLAAWICVGRRLGRGALAVLVAGALAVGALYAGTHWLYPTSLGPRPEPALWTSLAAPLGVVGTIVSLLHVGLSRLVSHVWWWPSHYGSTAFTLFGVAAALLLAAGTALAAAPRRRWLAGLLLLAIAAYAAIAVGRAHVQQQMMFGGVVFAVMQRYHYLASIPLALCLTLAAAALAARLRPPPRLWNGLGALVLALLLVAFWRGRWMFPLNAGIRAETAAVLRQAARAAADAPRGTTVYVLDRRFNFANIWDRGYTSAGIFTLFNATGEIDGRTIRYLPDPRWSPAAPPAGSRLERLLVRWPPQCRDEPWTPAEPGERMIGEAEARRGEGGEGALS